jgi:hypothetical protein
MRHCSAQPHTRCLLIPHPRVGPVHFHVRDRVLLALVLLTDKPLYPHLYPSGSTSITDIRWVYYFTYKKTTK